MVVDSSEILPRFDGEQRPASRQLSTRLDAIRFVVCFDNEATGMPHISCFATLDDADVAGAALRVRIQCVSQQSSLPPRVHFLSRVIMGV